MISFFLLDADVADEVVVSDIYAVWDVMFANWEHGSISFDYLIRWVVLPIPLGRRRLNSFVCPRSQWSASGTCSNF